MGKIHWNYAILSHMAKLNGGPEVLVEKLINSGVIKGRKSMLPIVAGASAMSFLVGAVIRPYGDKLMHKLFNNKYTPEEIEDAKKELIEGIKEYDKTHPDESNKDQNTKVAILFK